MINTRCKEDIRIVCKLIIALLVILICLTGCRKVVESKGSNEIVVMGSIINWTNNVTKDEAKKLIQFLDEGSFFSYNNIPINIDKSSDSYLINISDKNYFPDLDESYKLMAEDISMLVYDNAIVEIHICDADFKTLKIFKSLQ